MSPIEHVAIIGGGFTGLTAALRLAQRGCRVSVIEREHTLGGLAAGFCLQGTSIERTYHHLFRTDYDVLNLVRELNVEDHLIWRRSSVGIWRDGRAYPFMSPSDLLHFKPCNLIGRVRLGLIALYLKKKKSWREFEGQSARDWMRRACGESAMRAVWDPLLRGKFDRYALSVSMAWLWARIHIRANSRENADAEKLGYFRGGFAVVTDALERALLSAGGNIYKNTSVEELKIIDGRPALNLNGGMSRFDRCLFTGPSPVLAQLLPRRADLQAYRQHLESVTYLGAICLVFVSDQDLGDFYWLNINEESAPFLVFINHTKLVGTEDYHGKHIYYIGCYLPQDDQRFSLPDQAIIDQWLTFLRTIYPGFEPERVVEKHLFRFKYAQHLVDTDFKTKIPDYRTPLPGVYLANFSQIFPEDRGVNFAVREGNKIAQVIISDTGGH